MDFKSAIDFLKDWKEPVITVIGFIKNVPDAFRKFFPERPESIIQPTLYDIINNLDVSMKPCKLERVSGMLVPLTLLKGNIQEYKEDWPRLIKEYETKFNIDWTDEKYSKIREKFAFAKSTNLIWNLWGPSYEDDLILGDYEILQFGEGDEYNAIPVMISKKILDNHKIMFNPGMRVNPILTDGMLVSLKNVKIQEFIQKLKDSEKLENENLKKWNKINDKFSKIFIIGKELNYEFFNDHNFNNPIFVEKRPSDFYSAYMWAELWVNMKLKNYPEPIKYPVYLFDHANISNASVLDQYTEMFGVKFNYFFHNYGNENITLGECTFKAMRENLRKSTGIKLEPKTEKGAF
jgi:hypothetical protein